MTATPIRWAISTTAWKSIPPSGNTVGGTTSGARDLISGNLEGVEISDTGTSGNLVEGDYIGLAINGTTAFDANGFAVGNLYGVYLAGQANDNTIGGTIGGAANVISGNQDGGIYIAAAVRMAR